MTFPSTADSLDNLSVPSAPRARNGRFRNPVKMHKMGFFKSLGIMLRFAFDKPKDTVPTLPIPFHAITQQQLLAAPDRSLFRLGHSTVLLKLNGNFWLTDPVFSERASPVQWAGPQRFHQPPISIDDLPPIKGVILSHDHYDHLDLPTVRALVRDQDAPFVVPLGVGAHLRRWQVPESRIIELDWNDSAEIGPLRITATAAQHFSGRGLRRDGTLWASWVVAGPARKVFYSGDTGYFDGYAEIGAEHGPFDVALVQIGAYSPSWPDIHMTPEEGVATAIDVRADLLIPVHWATFNLAMHSWTEPVDRVWREAKARGLRLAVPRPGDTIDVDDPAPVDGWWQALAG